MGDKIQKLEEKTNLMEKELHVIQATKPSWTIEKDAKLIDLEDRSRRNNLKFEGIKEHENEPWENCKKKSMIYWKTNLKLTLETLSSDEHIEPGRKTIIDRGL